MNPKNKLPVSPSLGKAIFLLLEPLLRGAGEPQREEGERDNRDEPRGELHELYDERERPLQRAVPVLIF